MWLFRESQKKEKKMLKVLWVKQIEKEQFKQHAFRGCRQRKSTREGFGELLGVFEGYLGESFPCRNPEKHIEKTNKNQDKTNTNYFYNSAQKVI